MTHPLYQTFVTGESNALAPMGPDWVDKNFPPKKDHLYLNQGVCPHFGVICKAADLLGINEGKVAADQHYCGYWMDFDFSGHSVMPDEPNRICLRIARDLAMLVQAAEDTIKYPIRVGRDGKVRIKIDCYTKELDGILTQYSRGEAGRRALAKLMENTPPLHYKSGKVRSRSEKESLRYARKILRQLCKITLGVETDEGLVQVILGHHKDKGCELSAENIREVRKY